MIQNRREVMSAYHIVNGTVHTMGKQGVIPNGEVLVVDGKIAAVGTALAVPQDCMVLDATGKIVMPGMIDAHCHAGMIEAGGGPEGNELNETASPVTPELRAIDGINPRCESFSDGYKAGITMVATGPGSANVIGGTFAVLKTYGRTVDDMVVKHPLAMKMAFGENPKRVYGGKDKSPVTRMASAAIIRTWLAKAKEYADKKDKSITLGDTDKAPAFDSQMEALELVIRKKIPIKAHAHRADDILTALRIAREFDVDITLDHCTEGHLIVEELGKCGKGIIVGPSFMFKSKPEVKNRTFETVKLLVEAGALVAIMTDLPCSPLEFLPTAAGMAIRAGLSEPDAMACITISAARILGLEQRVGSLEVGKDADLLIHDPEPLTNLLSRNRMTMIDGRIVFSDL
jgi:imidazolonepropionase-like amidohydrolase